LLNVNNQIVFQLYSGRDQVHSYIKTIPKRILTATEIIWRVG